MTWQELGYGNYLLTTSGERLNTGLIIGQERAMVIDTGCGPRQAKPILEAVRSKTELPLIVVNTHAHYDHFLGNAVFADAGVTEIWAHENAAKNIAEEGEAKRAFLSATEEPEMAAGAGEHTQIVAPTAVVAEQPVLVDLGGSTVTLFYLGRGHTDGDLLVGSSNTIFAGDLVEEGGYPHFDDSYPAEWAATLRQLSALRNRFEFLVPGHGKPVNDEYVQTFATTMSTAVRQARAAARETPGDATKAIPILPYGPEQSRWFLARLQEK